MKYLLALLLLAAPLSAQDRDIAIVPAEQTNNIYIQFDSLRAILEDIFAGRQESMSIDTMNVRLAEQNEILRQMIEQDRECNTCGGVPVTQISTGAIAVILTLIWFKMDGKGKNGTNGVDGQDGMTGPQGEPGPQGPQGDDGESGESK